MMATPATAANAVPEPRSRRRRGRYGLRWLLFAVACCAVLFACVAYFMRQHQQRVAVVDRLQSNPALIACTTEWKTPDWLGYVPWGNRIEWFDRLIALHFWADHPSSHPAPDAVWNDIAQLDDLYYLSCGGFALRAEQIGMLESLAHLHQLGLAECTFEPGAVAQLGKLRQLESLWLDRSQINDDSLAELAGLTQVRDLGLSYTQVTDEGMTHLRGFADLRNLHLSATRVTEEGWRPLQAERPALNVLDD